MLLSASHPSIAKHREHGLRGDVWLVSCGQSKRSTPTWARDLYTGDVTRKQIAFVQRRSDGFGNDAPWAILSARHGVVDGGQVVAPYDEALTKMSPAERKAWARMVVSDLEQRGLQGCIFHVMGGAHYVGPLAEAIAEAGLGRVVNHWDSPFREASPQIGERKASLKRAADVEASWDEVAARAVDLYYWSAA